MSEGLKYSMNISNTWQPQQQLAAIIFDCDSTLSSIEGMDELAKENHVGQAVEALTLEAMSVSGINPELYQKRLELIRPNKKQVLTLGQHYFTHLIPDALQVIRLLQFLKKNIYMVSAGVNPAIAIFGELLQIPSKNIFAVDLEFDLEGNFKNYNKLSPLIHHDGKRLVVKKIKTHHSNIAYIGDGLNDLATQDIVTRFIGYGGVAYRHKIANQCQYYIHTASLAPLLPLTLTENEVTQLQSADRNLYENGLVAIYRGEVFIKR